MRQSYINEVIPIARSDRPLKGWHDLARQVVRVTESNEHARRIAESYGAQVRILRAPAQALMLMRTGECGAAIDDRAVLDLLFTKLNPPASTGSLAVTARLCPIRRSRGFNLHRWVRLAPVCRLLVTRMGCLVSVI